MPYRNYDEPIKKIYYGIHEVAYLVGVSQTTIRYWCERYNIIILKRDSRNRRSFNQKELGLMYEIYALSRVDNYKAKGVEEKIKQFKKQSYDN